MSVVLKYDLKESKESILNGQWEFLNHYGFNAVV